MTSGVTKKPANRRALVILIVQTPNQDLRICLHPPACGETKTTNNFIEKMYGLFND